MITTKIERIYIGKLHRLADPNLIEEDLDKNNIFFDQRKYKYLSYAFLRNHYYEWSNVECESCKKKGYRHNPFMNSCEKAKEILEKIHEILQENKIANDERDRIGYNYGYDVRTVIMRIIKKHTDDKGKMLKDLNELIRNQIYPETAKYDD